MTKLKAVYLIIQFLMITVLAFARPIHIPHFGQRDSKSNAAHYRVWGTPTDGTTNFNSTGASLLASGVATGDGVTASNVEGFNFRLTTASSATMNIEIWDGSTGTGDGIAFYEESGSINPPFTGIFMTANDGSRFDLVTIGVDATNSFSDDASITLTGLDAAGNPVSGATYSGIASASSLTTFDVNSVPAFKGIYGVRITSPDMTYAFIDNINLANVTQSTAPVRWLDFTAKQHGSAIDLKWSTAIETEADVYKVQHSITGVDWNIIGVKAAAGNSTMVKRYTFVHENPMEGTNYYRLLQRDMDGKEAYSKVVAVNFAAAKTQLSIYPNPVANGQLNLKLQTAATVWMYNSSGHLLLKMELLSGVHQIDLKNYPPGVYTIKAGNETTSFVVR